MNKTRMTFDVNEKVPGNITLTCCVKTDVSCHQNTQGAHLSTQSTPQDARPRRNLPNCITQHSTEASAVQGPHLPIKQPKI